MGYVKSFRSLVRLNESEITPAEEFMTNAYGVVLASQAKQYKKIPQLANQMQQFENTTGIDVGVGDTSGFDLFIELIIAQLSSRGTTVEGGKGYTKELESAIKDFQTKNSLSPTGKVDHSTYNVLFGKDPIGSILASSKNKKLLTEDVIPYEKYKKLVAKVIDNLEGGYYHPRMMDENPKVFKKDVYGNSGETLFGLDRHAGHGLYYKGKRISDDVKENIPNIETGKYEYVSPEARDFWTTVDTSNKKKRWEYNDRGDALEPKLRELAGIILKPDFNKYFDAYLSKEVQPIVKGDERLLFHFIYATWNGPKFWQKFAKQINDAYLSGKTSADQLYEVAMQSRLNSKVSGSATKIMELYGKPKSHKSMSFED